VVAGGCFWCVESDFDKVYGVKQTTSGYTGGDLSHPTYENHGGHREAVEVVYNPSEVTLAQLLFAFWRMIDPTDSSGSFCDRGDAYTSAIFAADDQQRQEAETSKQEAQAELGQAIVTPIVDAKAFWPAEDYHQDYHHKNPERYQYYRNACGRDARVQELWGQPFSGQTGR